MIKVRISLALLTYVGKEFQSFAARNENDLWHHSLVKLCSIKVCPTLLNYNYRFWFKKILLQNSYVHKIEAVERKLKSWTMLHLCVCIVSILFTCVRTALTTTTATRTSKSNWLDKRSISSHVQHAFWYLFFAVPAWPRNLMHDTKIA